MYFRDRDMMWKKKKLCEIENSKIHIREIQRRGSGNIESKGEHALNKNRTITQGLEINLRTFEWIGLNSETNGEPLSMLSMKLDIIRFVVWKDHAGFLVRKHCIFYGKSKSLIEKPKWANRKWWSSSEWKSSSWMLVVLMWVRGVEWQDWKLSG